MGAAWHTIFVSSHSYPAHYLPPLDGYHQWLGLGSALQVFRDYNNIRLGCGWMGVTLQYLCRVKKGGAHVATIFTIYTDMTALDSAHLFQL